MCAQPTEVSGGSTPCDPPSPEDTTVRAGELGSEAGTELYPKAAVPLPGNFVHGSRIGAYRLLEVAGFGGMGQVWKAMDTRLQRVVALKFLTVSSPDAVARFQQEANLAASLRHPNIAQVHAFVASRPPAIAMEYIDGVPLSAWEGDALPLLAHAAEAVHYAHSCGILHRDLKPSNLLVDTTGRVVVVDFGLARRISSDQDLTRTGAVLGTPGYMAPEQASGEPGQLDQCTDVYGLGATLYALLAGRPPHTGPNTYAILRAVLQDDPVPPGGSRDLQTIALKALHKDPRQRYASALELAQDLRRALAHEPILARHTTYMDRLRKRIRRRPLVSFLLLALSVVLLVSASLLVRQWLQQRRLIVELEASESSLRTQSRTLAERNRRLELQGFYERSRRALFEARDRLARKCSDEELAALLGQLRTLEDSLAARLRAEPGEPALPFLQAELRALIHQRGAALNDYSRALELPATNWSRALEIAPQAAYGRARIRLRSYFIEFFDQSGSIPQERFAQARGELAARVSADLDRAAGAVPVRLEQQLRIWQALIGGDSALVVQAQEVIEQGGSHPEVLFVLGLHYHLLGNPAEAARWYSESLRQDSNQPVCLHARSLCNWGSSQERAVAQDLSQVIADSRQALRLDASLEPAHYLLAVAIGESDGLPAAEAVLDQAIEKLPHSTRLLGLRALARGRLGRREDALADLDRALRIEPGNAPLLRDRADQRFAVQDWDRALEDYTTALRIDPEQWEARCNRAVCCLMLEQPALALSDADWLLARAPANEQVLNLVGAVRAEASDFEGALEVFDALLQLGDNPDALYNSARVLMQMERDEEARGRLQQLLVLQPARPAALELLVPVLVRLGRLEEACAVMTQRVDGAPEQPELLRRRAGIRAELGDLPGARADLTRALELLEPVSEAAREVRSELESLEGERD